MSEPISNTENVLDPHNDRPVTELIKSVSIENLIHQRAALLKCIDQAIALLQEAQQIAESMQIDCPLFCVKRGGWEENITSIHSTITGIYPEAAKLMDFVCKAIDVQAWQYLMNESGLRRLMDATAREEWDQALVEDHFPALTHDNILATFKQLHDARADMFERGVVAVFRRLSWDVNTDQPFKFGKRIVINRLFDKRSWSYAYPFMNHSTVYELDDLVRVFCVLDGQPEPDHRQGMHERLREAVRAQQQKWNGLYFSMRWFKKGTAHLTFTRPDLVEQMNRILAKHYPNALAAHL